MQVSSSLKARLVLERFTWSDSELWKMVVPDMIKLLWISAFPPLRNSKLISATGKDIDRDTKDAVRSSFLDLQRTSTRTVERLKR